MENSNKFQTSDIKKMKKQQTKKRKLEAFLELVHKDDLSFQQGMKSSEGTFQENYKALKDELRKYQKKKLADPLFHLKYDGWCAQVNLPLNYIGMIGLSCIAPLFVEDLYPLLLTSVLGNLSPLPLRWAKVEFAQNIAKTVLFEIEGLSSLNMAEMQSTFNETDCVFPFVLEILSRSKPFATELSTFDIDSVFNNQEKNLSTMFPMNEIIEVEEEKTIPQYNFSKLHLLLSPIQLAMENIPLPKSIFEQSKTEDYCFTKDVYTPVHDNSPMFAIDCEMCKIAFNKQAVTRVAIVNENLETVYHSFVKPEEEIVDYVTRFSGITPAMLRNVTTSLKDVQNDIRRILPGDAILCGQSINFDLHALKMIHPYVIDTSVIFNERGIRQMKTSLRKLTYIHLKESIQAGKHGHSPIEDSIATMKLVQLKLQKYIEYGDKVLQTSGTIPSEKALDLNPKKVLDLKPKKVLDPNQNTVFSTILKFSKKFCLVGSKSSLSNYYSDIIPDSVSQLVESNNKKIIKAISENIDNHDIILGHIVSDLKICPFTELNDEIKQAYENFPSKTLFIILIPGVSQPSQSFKKNYCMITIKK